jgi:hypothetical protein
MLKYELRAYAYGTYDHEKKFWFKAVSYAKKIEAKKIMSRSTIHVICQR